MVCPLKPKGGGRFISNFYFQISNFLTMKPFIQFGMTIFTLLILTSCTAQIKNAQTETVKIYGNCGMCEKTIETAAFQKGVARADWNQDTKMAVITFNSKKTNLDGVLKRIALSGYDSDSFTAPDDVYAGLHGCCQYDRPNKNMSMETAPMKAEMKEMPVTVEKTVVTKTVMSDKEAPAGELTINPLTDVYTAYFLMKDALVADNAGLAVTHSNSLLNAIGNVNMGALTSEQHTTWMNYTYKLMTEAKFIGGSTALEVQRAHFETLSNDMYQVMKVIKPETEVYLDHCPMYNDGKGGNWLSKEKGIKNPFYGKSMLTCGKVKETLD